MNTYQSALLTSHLLATTAMAGLIWFVQVVHYPLFAAVGSSGFAEYEQQHQRRTSVVVGPLMAIEGITAVWLVIAPPDGLSRALPVLGLVILGIIQASTVFLQVPQHARLASGYDRTHVDRLVRTNWVRTVGWTIRGVIAGMIVVQVMSP